MIYNWYKNNKLKLFIIWLIFLSIFVFISRFLFLMPHEEKLLIIATWFNQYKKKKLKTDNIKKKWIEKIQDLLKIFKKDDRIFTFILILYLINNKSI